ncbi:MAG: hypothetical protein HY680_08675 [Chloroflexi bacterium]|nr:hypothetical protein [Chloroflexota bacterium]
MEFQGFHPNGKDPIPTYSNICTSGDPLGDCHGTSKQPNPNANPDAAANADTWGCCGAYSHSYQDANTDSNGNAYPKALCHSNTHRYTYANCATRYSRRHIQRHREKDNAAVHSRHVTLAAEVDRLFPPVRALDERCN